MTGPDPDDVLERLRERLAVNSRHVLASDQQPQLGPRGLDPEQYLLTHHRPERNLGRSR